MNDSRKLQDIESICSGKLSHLPSQRQSSKSLIYVELRPKPATWYMELVRDTRNVFGNPRAVTDSSQIPYQGILHSTNQSATGGIPVQSTGRPVAKGEEQIGSTVPMPSFARRPSAMSSQVISCSGFPSEAMFWIKEVEMVKSVDD